MAEINCALWNCSGILLTSSAEEKMIFLKSCTNTEIDILILIETHHKLDDISSLFHTLPVFSSITHFSFFSFAFHNDTPTPIQTYFPIRRALERFQTVVNLSLSYANPLEFYKSLSHSLRIRYQNTFLFQNHPT